MKRLFSIIIICAFAASTQSAITRVQVGKGTANNSTALLLTFGTALTVGNWVCGVATCTAGSNNFYRTTNASNTTPLFGLGIVQNTGPTLVQVFCFKVLQASLTSLSLNILAGTGTGPSIAIAGEYTGKNLVMDQGANSTGVTANPATGTTQTTSTPNQLIIAGLANRTQQSTDNTTYFTSPLNSFSIVEQHTTTNNTANGDKALAMLELIVTSTGTYSTGATAGGSNNWAGIIATIYENPQVVSATSGE